MVVTPKLGIPQNTTSIIFTSNLLNLLLDIIDECEIVRSVTVGDIYLLLVVTTLFESEAIYYQIRFSIQRLQVTVSQL